MHKRLLVLVLLAMVIGVNIASADVWPLGLDYGMPRQKAEQIVSAIKGTPSMRQSGGTGWVKDIKGSADYSYKEAEIVGLTFINDKLYEFVQIRVFWGVGDDNIDKVYTNAKAYFDSLVKEAKADKKHPIIEELPVFLKADYGNGTARLIGSDKKKGNIMGRQMEGLEVIDAYGPNLKED